MVLPPWSPRCFLSSLQTTITPNKTASNSSTPARLHWPSRGNCKKGHVAFEHISQSNEDSGRAGWTSMMVFSKYDIFSELPTVMQRDMHLTARSVSEQIRWNAIWDTKQEVYRTWVYPVWDGNMLRAPSWSAGICNAFWTANALMLNRNSLTNDL